METDVRFDDATTLTVERTLPGPIERVWAYLCLLYTSDAADE